MQGKYKIKKVKKYEGGVTKVAVKKAPFQPDLSKLKLTDPTGAPYAPIEKDDKLGDHIKTKMDYLDVPQRAAMWTYGNFMHNNFDGVKPKFETPSEHMKSVGTLSNSSTAGKVVGLAADVALDPTNLLPLAAMKKLGNIGKFEKVSQQAVNAVNKSNKLRKIYNGGRKTAEAVDNLSDTYDTAKPSIKKLATIIPKQAKGNSGIKIKPENKGKFTAKAVAKGEGIQEYAQEVLSNKESNSPATVKQANFAKNAAGWNKYSKGTKGIKKYAAGVKNTLLDENGALEGNVAGIGGIASGVAALGIEGLTKSNYDGKYTSQLQDENQALGRGIGGAVGQGLNLVVPGLGAVAAPLLSSVGGAIQRGFQGDKLEQIKKNAEYKDAVAKGNEGIGTDLTAFQAKQFSKGGTTKTKVIEIEGKGTPEIHTDKNFNLKNLGTIPHSKGGNKVVAEEGDVVFPTQNSPEKFKEVIDAVMSKDKFKLKKEQAKLPADKAPKKYVGGTSGVETAEEKAYREKKKANSIDTKLINNFKDGWDNGITKPIERIGAARERGNYYNEYGAANYKKKYGADYDTDPVTQSQNTLLPSPLDKQATDIIRGNKPATSNVTTGPNYSPLKPKVLNGGGWFNDGKGGKGATKTTVTKDKGASKSNVVRKKAFTNPNTPVTPLTTKMEVKAQPTAPDKVNPITPTQAAGVVGTTNPAVAAQTKKGFGLNEAMELAPIAANLGQGLFGTPEKVNRQEYKPQLENYVDTSNPMRREVNSQYQGNLSNARNLSAGNAANFRANAQSAANDKFTKLNTLDNQEYGKQVDVNNRNVNTINSGKQINFDAFNKYEDIDAQNRAVKSNALSKGFEQMGELGSRNILQKNQLSNQLATANLLKNNYKVNIDENGQAAGGTQFESGAGATYSNNLLTPKPVTATKTTTKTKTRGYEKGAKSLQVTRKYKLK